MTIIETPEETRASLEEYDRQTKDWREQVEQLQAEIESLTVENEQLLNKLQKAHSESDLEREEMIRLILATKNTLAALLSVDGYTLPGEHGTTLITELNKKLKRWDNEA
jgi:regulator of replication initiation timing